MPIESKRRSVILPIPGICISVSDESITVDVLNDNLANR
jgi:hypothetical protein